MKPSLLIVDDDRGIREGLEERFVARGFEVTTAADGREGIESARARPDLMLLDLQLPHRDGMDVLRSVREFDTELAVIVITAHGTVPRAVEALQSGAYDFVEKPFDPGHLEAVVGRALEHARLRRSHRAFSEKQAEVGVVAEDPKMLEQLRIARKVARSDASVLICGESGTGKEVVAQQLHQWSERSDGPLVAVNCAALSESLLESELFGHEKGAFTGAATRHRGRIESAHRGTLFLDEIGDVSLGFQAKLLRVLQQRSFERVGGTDTVQVDVRIIAATNRDLDEAVRSGAFREDLFYRLNVIQLMLPPLRERPRDVIALAEHFASEFAASTGVVADLSEPAREFLVRHRWPGNVRELRNVIERAFLLAEGNQISCDDLAPEVIAEADLPLAGFHAQVEQFRRSLIESTLAACDGHRTRAAERLGLQRTYLARLIRQYGIE